MLETGDTPLFVKRSTGRPRNPYGYVKHPAYSAWRAVCGLTQCPWRTMEDFVAWCHSQGCDFEAGDRIVVRPKDGRIIAYLKKMLPALPPGWRES